MRRKKFICILSRDFQHQRSSDCNWLNGLRSSADEKIYGTLQQKKMVTSQVVDGVSETLNAPTHIPNTQKRAVFQTEATKRAAEPAEVTPKRVRSLGLRGNSEFHTDVVNFERESILSSMIRLAISIKLWLDFWC